VHGSDVVVVLGTVVVVLAIVVLVVTFAVVSKVCSSGVRADEVPTWTV
jgi:hypothetical protein